LIGNHTFKSFTSSSGAPSAFAAARAAGFGIDQHLRVRMLRR
jgi:hypothetical protein